MAALEVCRSQIVKYQAAVGEMALRQLPVHSLVEFSLVGRIQLQHLAQTVMQSVGMQSTRGRQLGGRLEDAGHNHGDDQIALSTGARIEEGVELELAQRAENRGDMAVRQRASDAEGIWQGPTRGR